MKTFKYFSGNTEVAWGGRTMANKEAALKFPGVKAVRSDSYEIKVGFATTEKGVEVMPITRVIEYKIDGSKHKCDARCLNATGHNCECSCGGKNHGAGNA